MIHLCCLSLDHDSYYIEALTCTDLRLNRISVRVDYIIVSYSRDMSAVHCHAILWIHPPELWVGYVDFILSFHDLIIEDS